MYQKDELKQLANFLNRVPPSAYTRFGDLIRRQQIQGIAVIKAAGELWE